MSSSSLNHSNKHISRVGSVPRNLVHHRKACVGSVAVSIFFANKVMVLFAEQRRETKSLIRYTSTCESLFPVSLKGSSAKKSLTRHTLEEEKLLILSDSPSCLPHGRPIHYTHLLTESATELWKMTLSCACTTLSRKADYGISSLLGKQGETAFFLVHILYRSALHERECDLLHLGPQLSSLDSQTKHNFTLSVRRPNCLSSVVARFVFLFSSDQ